MVRSGLARHGVELLVWPPHAPLPLVVFYRPLLHLEPAHTVPSGCEENLDEDPNLFPTPTSPSPRAGEPTGQAAATVCGGDRSRWSRWSRFNSRWPWSEKFRGLTIFHDPSRSDTLPERRRWGTPRVPWTLPSWTFQQGQFSAKEAEFASSFGPVLDSAAPPPPAPLLPLLFPWDVCVSNSSPTLFLLEIPNFTSKWRCAS